MVGQSVSVELHSAEMYLWKVANQSVEHNYEKCNLWGYYYYCCCFEHCSIVLID